MDEGNRQTGLHFRQRHEPGGPVPQHGDARLVQDLSAAVDLEQAVRSFETKVAPQNYQRPTALITPAMVKAAMKTIDALGIEESLQRRFARLSDVSVTNVLWVDNDARSQGMKDGIEGLLMQAATTRSAGAHLRDAKPKNAVVAFMKDILPGAATIDLRGGQQSRTALRQSHHRPVPGRPAAVPLEQRLRLELRRQRHRLDCRAGQEGRRQGRGCGPADPLSWFNYDDLDLHIYEPPGRGVAGLHDHISFRNKRGASWTST